MSETRPRWWLPWATFGVLWLLIECFAILASLIVSGGPPDLGEPAAVLATLAKEIELERADPNLEGFAAEVVHPYLGFVGNPVQVAAPGQFVAPRNAFGFVDDQGPIRPRDPDRLIVAILGGSVAERFGRFAAEYFERQLAQAEAAAGRRVELVRLGQSGFKQPQQLLTVAWLLSLGAHFDVVIALDGFNEVALHAAENAHQGVEPSFPRGWAMRAGGLPDPLALAQRGRALRLERERAGWASRFTGAPLRWSPAALAVWRWRDRALLAEQVETQQWLREYRPREARYAVQGPAHFDPPDPSADSLGRLVEVWENASLQLHRLAEGNGARYFHFLQPNQYFPGAKPMGEAERAIAFRPDHVYRPGALAGHPKLLAAGQRLRAAGVAFHDTSRIFRQVSEPIFVDDCCHMNVRGHELLADHMVREIAQGLARAGLEKAPYPERRRECSSARERFRDRP